MGCNQEEAFCSRQTTFPLIRLSLEGDCELLLMPFQAQLPGAAHGPGTAGTCSHGWQGLSRRARLWVGPRGAHHPSQSPS